MIAATAVPFTIRVPYVGAGVDGARRSAQIDRDEAATLEPGPLRDARLVSAAAWDKQAIWLELHEGRDPFDGGPVR